MEEPARAARFILLKDLLREKHWQPYRRFCREYDKAAARIDKELVGTFPSDSTYRRWLSGRIVGTPRSEPCAVLEEMFPEHTIEQLFEPQSDGGEQEETDSGVPASVQLSNASEPPVPTWRDPATATLPIADAYYSDVISSGGEVEKVNRIDFVTGLVATVAAPGLLLSSVAPMRVGSADVAWYRESLLHLYALDDHYGATGELYSLTVRSSRRLVRVLETASYNPGVGDELRSVTGKVMVHAGWLSFDARRDRDARYWWLESLHAARMAGDRDVEIVVLALMSLAALKYGHAREAVDLARSAKRIAQSYRCTPRLRSLLAAREALGLARIGDSTATREALDRAYADLDETRHDDDPEWLGFWGSADLAYHASRIGQHLGDLSMAEGTARGALAAGDARYSRNRALYHANLARVLIARRNVDEAIPAVAEAAVQASQFNSGRLTRMVHRQVGDLHSGYGRMPAVQELAEWTATNLSTVN
jgi:tetratricopeptide (TPR) repeat protein